MRIAAICAFGYRFLADELAGQGHLTSERRVWRLCSQAGLWSSFVKKSRSSKRAGAAVHDDLVLRNFSANRANQLWFTDITEHPTKNGKLYMCSLEVSLLRADCRLLHWREDDIRSCCLGAGQRHYLEKANWNDLP
jgi:transposase InsO family protein